MATKTKAPAKGGAKGGATKGGAAKGATGRPVGLLAQFVLGRAG